MNTPADDRTLTGTWRNGQIVLDGPADWPEGCRVVVTRGSHHEAYGMTEHEHEQSDDPAAIARWLSEFDSIPPWQMTAEEEAEWRGARQAITDYTIANMQKRLSE
jgi:hypothetical protein